MPMSDTKKIKSLTFIGSGTEKPKLSACLVSGEHWYLEFGGPAQVALLAEQVAAYTAEQVRRASAGKPI